MTWPSQLAGRGQYVFCANKIEIVQIALKDRILVYLIIELPAAVIHFPSF